MDIQSLGAFIQSRRKDLGMTQSQLGAKLHVTDKAVSRWERGVGFPDVKLLEPLAEALQISVSELMRCQADAPLEQKKKPWIARHRTALAVLCFAIYIVMQTLSAVPGLAQQQAWMSPLHKVLFLVMAAAFLYASYREVSYDD